MFKYERSTLFGMALETSLILAHFIHRAAPFDHRTLVRVMAIRATDFSFKHRMMMRQIELRTHLKMALEAGLRRFLRIDNRLGGSALGDVNAAWAVTRFAADILCIFSMRH